MRPARSALWEACRQRAAAVGGGCEARLVRERVASLAELDALHGPHDAVIVAAGAAVGALPELRASRAVQICSGARKAIHVVLSVRGLVHCHTARSYIVPLFGLSVQHGKHLGQQHVRARPQARRPMTTAAHVAGGLLPLDLCQGYTLELAAAPGPAAAAEPAAQPAGAQASAGGVQPVSQAGAGATGAGGAGVNPAGAYPAGAYPAGAYPAGAFPADAYPAGAPSVLGEVYYAAQGRGALVVGATRRYGLSPEAALAECGRRVDARSEEAVAAAQALQPPAAALWPPAAAWQVRGGALGAFATRHPTRTGGGCQGRPPSDWC